MSITFTKVSLPFGWLGNMAPFPIVYHNEHWRTSEALFQAMRFDDPEIKLIIRNQTSPMAAKMKAKGAQNQMVIVPCSPQDVENMRICLELKFTQHNGIRQQLLQTGDDTIIENIGTRRGARHLFWGAYQHDNQWIGNNMMGQLLMELREKLQMGD
jgi:ribA/ribD-fused uncharacterized protein